MGEARRVVIFFPLFQKKHLTSGAPPAGPKVQAFFIHSPQEFLKIDEFHIGENRGKRETFEQETPQKQRYLPKQSPPLSLII